MKIITRKRRIVYFLGGAILNTLFSFIVCEPVDPCPEALVFQEDFNDANAAPRWALSAGTIKTGWKGTPSLCIASESTGSGAVATKPLDAKKLAGRLITFGACVKCDGISAPPNSWNGIKVMLVIEEGESRQYPQLSLPAEAFSWREAFQAVRIPAGATKAVLVVGLEKVSGAACFDDIFIRIGRPGGKGRRQKERCKGHTLPRLRGVMHGPKFCETDIHDLARTWGANMIRWQLNWTPMNRAEVWARDLSAYDRWLEGALKECDKALAACAKYNIMVLVDLHTPPGGRVAGGVCPLFQKKACQEKFIDVWRRIAARYKGNPVVYAYDLLNEAVEGSVTPGLLNWRDLATEAARAVRSIDPGKPVVFEPSPWGGPDGFDALVPLDIDRVIYSFHMYRPHQFTHQSIYSNTAGIRYPGKVAGRMWDKEKLREAMLPAIDFQRIFNVHIYVGEFSAIRWAPDSSAYRYLRDVIDLFEEYGWDWSYHAFREWDGWSVEHGSDRENRRPVATPTKRGKLLRSWFGRNKQPELRS